MKCVYCGKTKIEDLEAHVCGEEEEKK